MAYIGPSYSVPEFTWDNRRRQAMDRQAGETDADWKTTKEESDKAALRRRRWGEGLDITSYVMRNINVGAILGGAAALVTDSYIKDFIPDNVRENILNVGTFALAGTLATELATRAGAEYAYAPDKRADNAAEVALRGNKLGGKQLLAKIGKTGAWLAKWGLIGVAGVAAAEGLFGEEPVEGTIAQFWPNHPDVEPEMTFPAAALAVGSEIVKRNFKKQDEVYDAATNFIKYDAYADDKNKKTKEEASLYKSSKDTLRKNVGKMSWGKLFTGDILESIWWKLQKDKFDYEGKLGSGVSTLPELIRRKNNRLESFIGNFKRYQSVPFIATGILGLLAPALEGNPLPDAMMDVEEAIGVGPAIWAGLALTGIAKQNLIDKPNADFYAAFKNATEVNLNSGREKYIVPKTIKGTAPAAAGH